MLSQQDGPFINLARLNIGKYSKRPNVAKALFEYIFYHENSMREAMELASQVSVISITQVLGFFFCLLVVFSACGGIRTGRRMPVLTAYFPVLAWGILGKGGLFVRLYRFTVSSVADCQALT